MQTFQVASRNQNNQSPKSFTSEQLIKQGGVILVVIYGVIYNVEKQKYVANFYINIRL